MKGLTTLVSIDIETTPIDKVTKDIEKVWCICYAWKEGRDILTDEIVFPDGITKEELALRKTDKDTLTKLYFLQEILSNKNNMIPIFHGSQFEYRHLTESGFSIGKFHDSMLLGYVLNPRYESHSLAAWGERDYCDVKVHDKVDIEEFFGSYKREIVDRCVGDVRSTLQLGYRLIDELKQDERGYDIYENIDIPFVPVLVEMCRNGVYIDGDKLNEFTIEVESNLEQQKNRILELVPVAPGSKKTRLSLHKEEKIATPNSEGLFDESELGKFIHVGVQNKLDKTLGMERPYQVYRKIEEFNPASTDQKVWALFAKDGFISEEMSEKTGKPKVDHFALEEAAAKGSDIADSILEYQKLNKLYTSFCVPFENKRHTNGRIYADFNNTVTSTGRLSCSSPNLQQIPVRDDLGSKLRYCVVPEDKDNVIISIDLSGAEMRILGWYLVKILGDKYEDAWFIWNSAHKGEDLHRGTMDLMNLSDEERIVAKTLAFGDVYGMGLFKFARTLKCNISKAKSYLDIRHTNMPSIKALKNVVWEICRRRNDHTIHTLFGRRLTYGDIVDRDGGKRSRAERQAFNAVIQGTQGDIIKIMMIEAMSYIYEAAAKIMIQVHDELVLECPKATAEWLADKLGGVFTRSDLLPGMPLVGEATIGNSWGETKG